MDQEDIQAIADEFNVKLNTIKRIVYAEFKNRNKK